MVDRIVSNSKCANGHPVIIKEDGVGNRSADVGTKQIDPLPDDGATQGKITIVCDECVKEAEGKLNNI